MELGTGEIVANTLLWSGLATALIWIPGVLLAYVLARFRFPGKSLLSALVTLPLVLPPTAVGYVLLGVLSRDAVVGRALQDWGWDVLLTWKAVVLACSVMAFPLFVRTARVGFEETERRLEVMIQTLGWPRWLVFLKVTLPLAGKSLFAATVLAFTRAMGEFGATVVVAGNIPGRTQTLASAIYSAQQRGDDEHARTLLLVAFAVGVAAVLTAEWLALKPKADR